MANMDLLRDKIDAVGIPITTLANKCGMTRHSLYNKLAGTSEFKASEISIISTVLNLQTAERNAIFFGD
jgi:DNA-binding phage protein